LDLLTLSCPKCGHKDLRRSKWRRNEAQHHVLRMPFRCEDCGERFLAIPRHRVVVPALILALVLGLMATAVGFYGALDPPADHNVLAAHPMISAAESGDRDAQHRLAIAYRDGSSRLGRDDLLAYKWFYAAALQGLPTAQYEVALLYKRGRGALQDFKEAFKWFEKAAQAGIPEAQYHLASAYMRGEGVQIDFVRAYAWYSRAASMGMPGAASARDQAALQMRPEELEKAQALSYEVLEGPTGVPRPSLRIAESGGEAPAGEAGPAVGKP
jgi:TPR repeat protein